MTASWLSPPASSVAPGAWPMATDPPVPEGPPLTAAPSSVPTVA
eukprot:CAMPEP_0171126892 /NCGR_PEP_ID=MMETSP0766_2-20121228/114227_1 /TAXON_ID=439317 /ORGANISM="Gambierdiscus australes, Strain CAWD 149" /LENGTH=43 /DNA_ID= /DNA_START= /DNA_END= /DNA_ORIENTATION=